MQVHTSKGVSSLEPRPLVPNETTEFTWEVRSLNEMLQKPGRLNGQIYAPFFDVHGTQGERIKGISGQDFTQGPKKARLSLMIVHQQHGGAHYTLRMSEEEGYRYSLEARIYSGDQEEKSAAVDSA